MHHLKGIIYHANYTAPDYSGQAVAIGGGSQALDAYTTMSGYNITLLMPGGSTVGLAGGFFQGGGHSSYTSFYGLAADHVVRINAVTADGRLVTADAETNEDLYWAFRGGGGGTSPSPNTIFAENLQTYMANEMNRHLWHCNFHSSQSLPPNPHRNREDNLLHRPRTRLQQHRHLP